MGFGTTFGGMGAASQGMDDAAQAENQRILSHQLQEQNAMRYRMMQEQDAATKQARAANKAMMESMPDPTGTLPQVNGGSVIPAPVKPQAAPAKTTGSATTSPTSKRPSQVLPTHSAETTALQRSKEDAEARLEMLRNGRAYAKPGDAAPEIASKDGSVRDWFMSRLSKESPTRSPDLDAIRRQEIPLQKQLDDAKAGTEKLKQLQSNDQFDRLEQSRLAGRAPQNGPMTLEAAVRHTESRGNVNAVSPKGAKGDMQVMDATNIDPGFGVAPARDGSPEERSRVGREYLAALEKRYGDPLSAAAAYNMGPAAFEKWRAAGSNPNNMPAETRKYVADVAKLIGSGATTQAQGAPTAQPQQAAAEAPSPFLPKEAAQAYGGPNIDQSMQQLQQMYKLLKLQADNAYDPGQQVQFMLQMHEVGARAQDLQIQQLGRSALFQPQALTQLVGLFAGQNGTQLAAQQDGKGNVRLALPDGTPAPGEWGKPMTLPTLVDAMQSQLSQGMRAQAAQRAAALQGVSDKANAEEGAKGRWKMAETEQQGRNAAAIAAINGDAALQAEVVKHGLSQNDFKDATESQMVPGRIIIRKNNMVYAYDSPVNNDPSKPAVQGKITVIPNPG